MSRVGRKRGMCVMSVRSEQAQRSRVRLLDCAADLFATRGYDATTVAEILGRAGQARGALYHYFPGGKQEIFAAVVDRIDAELEAEIAAAIAGTEDPLDRIAVGADAFLGACLTPAVGRTLLTEAPAVVGADWESGSEFLVIRTALADAVAAGTVVISSIDELALFVLGGIARLGLAIAADPRPERVASGVATVRAMLDALRQPGRNSVATFRQ